MRVQGQAKKEKAKERKKNIALATKRHNELLNGINSLEGRDKLLHEIRQLESNINKCKYDMGLKANENNPLIARKLAAITAELEQKIKELDELVAE